MRMGLRTAYTTGYCKVLININHAVPPATESREWMGEHVMKIIYSIRVGYHIRVEWNTIDLRISRNGVPHSRCSNSTVSLPFLLRCLPSPSHFVSPTTTTFHILCFALRCVLFPSLRTVISSVFCIAHEAIPSVFLGAQHMKCLKNQYVKRVKNLRGILHNKNPESSGVIPSLDFRVADLSTGNTGGVFSRGVPKSQVTEGRYASRGRVLPK